MKQTNFSTLCLPADLVPWGASACQGGRGLRRLQLYDRSILFVDAIVFNELQIFSLLRDSFAQKQFGSALIKN